MHRATVPSARKGAFRQCLNAPYLLNLRIGKLTQFGPVEPPRNSQMSDWKARTCRSCASQPWVVFHQPNHRQYSALGIRNCRDISSRRRPSECNTWVCDQGQLPSLHRRKPHTAQPKESKASKAMDREPHRKTARSKLLLGR